MVESTHDPNARTSAAVSAVGAVTGAARRVAAARDALERQFRATAADLGAAIAEADALQEEVTRLTGEIAALQVELTMRPLTPQRQPEPPPDLPTCFPMLGALSTTVYDPAKAPPSRVELPRTFLDSRLPATVARVVRVLDYPGDTPGAKLKAVIADVASGTITGGDVIVLGLGVYRGTFTRWLRPVDTVSSGPVLVISEAEYEAEYETKRSRQGQRIDPVGAAAEMPILETATAESVIRCEGKAASGFTFVGLHFRVSKDYRGQYGYPVVSLGRSVGQTSPDLIPEDLWLVRCAISVERKVSVQPDGTLGGQNVKRGVALHCIRGGVVDSHITDCYFRGADSQAIAMSDGPGPYKIVGNFLSATGEVTMCGGDDPGVPGLVPSDIEVRRNHLHKPAFIFNDPDWTVKTIVESKSSRRSLYEGNVLERNGGDGSGAAHWLKSEDQNGLGEGQTKYAETCDVTSRYSVILDAPTAYTIAATSGGNTADDYVRPLHGVHIAHIDFWGARPGSAASEGAFARVGGGISDITIEHVTSGATRHALYLIGRNVTNMRVADSALNAGADGALANSVPGVPDGVGGTEILWPGAVLEGNILVGETTHVKPGAFDRVGCWDQVPLGKGADFAAVGRATAGVRRGEG